MDKNDLEALKMLSDWSKWSILVQGAAIGAIGTFFKPEDIHSLNFASRFFLILSICSFAFSIMTAAWLLKTFPAIAQRLPPPDGKDIYHMRSWEGTQQLPIYWITSIQSLGFAGGILSFVIFIAMRIAS